MAGPSQVVHVDAIKTLAFGSISNSYAELGADFQHPVRIVRFVNTTDADMYISFDAVVDNLILPSNSFVLFDTVTNRYINLGTWVFGRGTQAYVKYISGAPTKGAVYLECLYGQGE